MVFRAAARCPPNDLVERYDFDGSSCLATRLEFQSISDPDSCWKDSANRPAIRFRPAAAREGLTQLK